MVDVTTGDISNLIRGCPGCRHHSWLSSRRTRGVGVAQEGGCTGNRKCVALFWSLFIIMPRNVRELVQNNLTSTDPWTLLSK